MPQTFDIGIGTSQDALSLADGLALFPKFGTLRAGIQTTTVEHSLINKSFSAVLVRYKVASYYTTLMGVLGPAISFKFANCKVELHDVPEGGEVKCDFGPDQDVVAGMAVAFVVGAGIQLTQEIAFPKKWYAPWEISWHQVFNLTLDVEIDFMALLVLIIQVLLGYKGHLTADSTNKLANFCGYGEQNTAQSFKFFAYGDEPLGPEETIEVTPELVIPWDLMNSFPAAKGFVEALSKIGGDVSFGPTLLVQMPVTFGVTGFTVNGSDGPQQYTLDRYEGTTAIATGSSGFTSPVTRFQTNVKYETGFDLGLSFFFGIGLFKLFSIGFSGPSLSLLSLLGLNQSSNVAENSGENYVATDVATGCILIPRMGMGFSANSDLLPDNNVISGIPFQGIVFLDPAWDGGPAHVTLAIDPSLAGFPESLPIAHGQSQVSFTFTVPNQCVLLGDFNDPAASAAASATYPNRTFLVTASLPPNSVQPCTEWEVTVPLKVYNRCLSLKLLEGTPGLSPPWNVNGGGQLNANTEYPPEGIVNSLQGEYRYNSAPNDTDTEAEITISLYNDERQLHSGSDVKITFATGQSAMLSPSAKLTLPIRAQAEAVDFTIEWLSKGPQVNYSTLFYLVMDGGCAYGQGEFWLNVWNWGAPPE